MLYLHGNHNKTVDVPDAQRLQVLAQRRSFFRSRSRSRSRSFSRSLSSTRVQSKHVFDALNLPVSCLTFMGLLHAECTQRTATSHAESNASEAQNGTTRMGFIWRCEKVRHRVHPLLPIKHVTLARGSGGGAGRS
eukprot:1079613-Amphidinium_carterae.1